MSEQDYLIEFMDKWSKLRRKNQENEAVWNRAKHKAAPALLSGKPQTLQDTAKLWFFDTFSGLSVLGYVVFQQQSTAW